MRNSMTFIAFALSLVACKAGKDTGIDTSNPEEVAFIEYNVTIGNQPVNMFVFNADGQSVASTNREVQVEPGPYRLLVGDGSAWHPNGEWPLCLYTDGNYWGCPETETLVLEDGDVFQSSCDMSLVFWGTYTLTSQSCNESACNEPRTETNVYVEVQPNLTILLESGDGDNIANEFNGTLEVQGASLSINTDATLEVNEFNVDYIDFIRYQPSGSWSNITMSRQ